ncbi:hypothetical protein J1614_003662 [Plenodomus biglobosus]|nr:hypothetical protein J1614_003662 [Plenodomus biglobosus]
MLPPLPLLEAIEIFFKTKHVLATHNHRSCRDVLDHIHIYRLQPLLDDTIFYYHAYTYFSNDKNPFIQTVYITTTAAPAYGVEPVSVKVSVVTTTMLSEAAKPKARSPHMSYQSFSDTKVRLVVDRRSENR